MSNDVIKSVYQNSLYQKILHEIDGVIFPLSDQWKRIGISVSGGLDSALMSVLLCSIITQNLWLTKVHIITNIRCWKITQVHASFQNFPSYFSPAEFHAPKG